MLDPSEPISIWDYALAIYALDGTAADFQCCQDDFGLDVNALIFALYNARNGQGFDIATTFQLTRTMTRDYVDPIRAVRIALKTPPPHCNAANAHALREQVKAVELGGERLILETLASLPQEGQVLSAYDALMAISALAGPVSHALEALLKRLALRAENM